jgi:hypothetical protein
VNGKRDSCVGFARQHNVIVRERRENRNLTLREQVNYETRWARVECKCVLSVWVVNAMVRKGSKSGFESRKSLSLRFYIS